MPSSKIIVVGLIIIIIAPFIAHATQTTTNMTWVIMINRNHTITYGGSCSDTNFYFKETDANFDPDIDGNGAKIKPTASPGVDPTPSTSGNERYTSFTVPCASSGNNCAFDVNNQTAVPSLPGTHDFEFTSTQYGNLDTIDGADANTNSNVLNRIVAQKYVFKILGAIHPQRIIDMNLHYYGSSRALSNTSNCSDSSGLDRDLNIYAYNYNTNQYDLITTRPGTGVAFAAKRDANAYMHKNDYTLANYVGTAPDNNITFLVRGINNTSNGRYTCLSADRVVLFYTAHTESTYCQSSSVAPMTIRNHGNTTINIDANFSSAFTGVDTNIVLKVWRGTPFCGNTGFGGWEKDCSVTNTVIAPGTTTCKQFNQSNATTPSRLISSIAVDGNGSLCFSGDINGFVPAGNHTKTFQTGSGV